MKHLSLVLLFFLTACLASTTGNDDTGNNNHDNLPATKKTTTDKCRLDNTVLGCSGYIEPIRNPYLRNLDIIKKPVKNYIIRSHTLHNSGGLKRIHGIGYDITTEVAYGTIDGLRNADSSVAKTKYSTTDFGEFIQASDAEKQDSSKNNIIKIKTGVREVRKGAGITDSSYVVKDATTNYYYSHIDGKQFVQFLPAINKQEILALNSGLEDNIFSGDRSYDRFYSHWYNKLEALMLKAKDLTFKGFSLIRFDNVAYYKDSKKKALTDNKLHTATFTLTFNSDLGKPAVSYDRPIYEYNPREYYEIRKLQRIRLSDDNFYSIVITLDKETDEISTPEFLEVSNHFIKISKGIVSKPKTKTIEIKNLNMFSDTPAKIISSNGIDEGWSAGSYMNVLASSETTDKSITQVAGAIVIHKLMEEDGEIPQHSRFIMITFASNEIFAPGDKGYVNAKDLFHSNHFSQ